jgi:hypothetical protein
MATNTLHVTGDFVLNAHGMLLVVNLKHESANSGIIRCPPPYSSDGLGKCLGKYGNFVFIYSMNS